ncbi:MAG TPA: UDP-3-O-acyl-N-acetylglucosamine deacetylase [Thermoanaerobaculia bacterium]|nr:UDP-3-O-acyl-N-acetylglucosamine deacetylase [Thermoanaerobaculia bacterium]
MKVKSRSSLAVGRRTGSEASPVERTPHPAQSQLFRQTTIGRPVAIDGVGIHTGQLVRLRLLPAPTGTGVIFRRTDSGGIEIPALASHVASLELATTLGRDDVTVSTVEHLMAAVHMAQIDNLVVEVDGPEVPILDGSALPYWRLLEAAGVTRQDQNRRIVAIREPVEVSDNGKRIRVSPYPGLRVTYALEYPQPSIGRQTVDVVAEGERFVRELAPARTFALLEDIERLHRNGLGLGGREDNCIVFDEAGPINTELRFADEPVRHKALDAIGDLALLGGPIWGHVEVERGGHLLHFRLIEALQARPQAWTFLSAENAHSTWTGDHDAEASLIEPPFRLSST